jgi:hypothetical protein
MSIHFLNQLFRAIHRTHDILFFLWVERYEVAKKLFFGVAFLATLGLSIVSFAELVDRWNILRPSPKRRDPRRVNAYVVAHSVDDFDDDSDLVTLNARLVSKAPRRKDK